LIRRRVTEGRSGSNSEAQTKPTPQQVGTGKTYRVVSVSLYTDQAVFVDETAEALLNAGFVKANRSLVIQTALHRLREELRGKNPAQIVAYFLQHQVRRPLASARKRNERPLDETGS
jgi:hypothetical protein